MDRFMLWYNPAMEQWQFWIITTFGVITLLSFLQSLFECKVRKRSYSNTPFYCGFQGAFVWADEVVFGLFWAGISIISLLLSDWILFLLSISLFWLVRAVGETVYWFFQQFTPRRGNEPKKFFFYHIVGNDSVYFMNQIYWQCLTVITILTSLYLGKLWLSS
jgi:hypothetical protein